VAHGQLQFEGRLQRRQAQLAEANAFAGRELGVGEIGQNLAPPQALGLLQQASRPIDLTSVRDPPGLTEKPLKVAGVVPLSADVDQIAATFGSQDSGTKDLAQLGDLLLQGLQTRGGWSLAPHGVEEGVGGDDPAHVDEEAGQHHALTGTAETEQCAGHLRSGRPHLHDGDVWP
jgi:hypothetical protein